MLHFVLLLFLTNAPTPSLSQTPSDHSPLSDFLSQITNTDNAVAQTWTLNSSFCTWIGVTCNPETERVTSLSLPNMNLEGTISPSIADLSFLEHLDLSNNSFRGRLIVELGRLPMLKNVDLSGNQLEGNVPRSLLRSRTVEMLNLARNRFGGDPWSAGSWNVVQVRVLDLSGNRFAGELDKSVGNLTRLEQLILSGNNFSGSIPPEIGYLTQLERLYLNENNLVGNIPPQICRLVNLSELVLSSNSLSGPVPRCIGSLQGLRSLVLAQNELESILPLSLWELKGLVLIDIRRNMIEGEIPPVIRMLEKVESINMSSNRFSGVIPREIEDLGKLRYLVLSNNSFNGPIPTSLGRLKSLEMLDISSNNLSGTIPVSLQRLSHLSSINVSYNHLEGQMPKHGIFSKSSREYFVHNGDLCGMPSLGYPLCSQQKRSGNTILRITLPIAVLVALIVISILTWMLYKRKRVSSESQYYKLKKIPGHQMISYQELSDATNGFNIANVIGVGSSGSVYKANLSNGTTVAVKVLDLKADEMCKRFDAECEVLRQLRHRNLVKVITTCSNRHWRSIVLEYMPNGNLQRWLYNKDYALDLPQRVTIMLDVAFAMEYLHHGFHQPVVHCDLNLGNVLLDVDMVAHVSDFGISKILAGDGSSMRTKTLGTNGYIAPEFGFRGIVSTAGDVYSYGIMLLEVLTRRRPTDQMFSTNRSLRQWVAASFRNSLVDVVDTRLFQLGNELDVRHHSSISSVIELALDCSKEAPEERIDMKEAVVRLAKIKEKLLNTQGKMQQNKSNKL